MSKPIDTFNRPRMNAILACVWLGCWIMGIVLLFLELFIGGTGAPIIAWAAFVIACFAQVQIHSAKL